jgi:hypothetical protein
MWGTIANIAVQAGTSLISGVQAQKMRKDQRKSEQEASNLLKDIYGELEKNQYAAVGLPMKAFELRVLKQLRQVVKASVVLLLQQVLQCHSIARRLEIFSQSRQTRCLTLTY